MKFIQIAQSLALVGTAAAAAVYSNTSFVPYGTGYFHDSQISYTVFLPNSGFDSFDIKTNQYGYGYVLDSQQISAIYSPSGTPFQVSVTEALKVFDVSADVTLLHEKSVDVTFGGSLLPLGGHFPIPSNYTAVFTITLNHLPQPIEKRAPTDQAFTITVVATGSTTPPPSSSSSVTTTTTTTATTTDTTTATKTITTCFDGHCITLAPVTVTTTNVICTECIPISTIYIITKTNIFTSNNQIITEHLPLTTTQVINYTTVYPNGKPTNAAPGVTITNAAPGATITNAAPVVTAAVQTAVQTAATPTTVVPVVKTTSVAPAVGTQTATFHGSGSRITGSVFALLTVLLSMLL